MSKLLFFAVSVNAFELGKVNVVVPNLEATVFVDLSNNTEKKVGATSKILDVSGLDLRIGYCETSEILVALGLDLVKLESFGININYAWKNSLDLTVGYWGGYNFKTEKFSYGLMGVFAKIKF